MSNTRHDHPVCLVVKCHGLNIILIEREREVNSRLKDEIILLKQKDLKHCGDLSTYKCIITSLASKVSLPLCVCDNYWLYRLDESIHTYVHI